MQSKGLSRVFSSISGLDIVGKTALIAWENGKQSVDPALDKWNYLIKQISSAVDFFVVLVSKIVSIWASHGGPVVRNLCFYCVGHWFYAWLGK